MAYGLLTAILGIVYAAAVLVLGQVFGGVGQDPWGNTKAGFSASGSINRKDFGIEWNAPLETGGVLVGDKVSITSCRPLGPSS